jgi:hypothetical protein
MQKKEFKVRTHGITKRITQIDENTVEVWSSMLGYPIRFELTDEFREFLRSF